MDLKSLLNKEQYEGAITVDGQVLILAGAGSGKTRVLTHRIAHMVEDLNIPSYNILAITFTNKAAKEMKDRVRNIISDKADSMWISTFHSTCVRILRREIDKIGYKKNFTIYDTSDQKVLIKDCMKILNIDDKDISQQEITSKISRAKDRMQTYKSYMIENEANFREKKIASVYEMYQKRLNENNALDFDDLIFKTVELFNKDEEVLSFYQNKFKYIMVDEYQDTNRVQYEFIRLLAKKYKNICVVGDDDQCIYQWRGADIKNILDFEKDYPGAKVIKLEQNYRSKGNILNAANEVIKHNLNRKSKVLRTDKEDGKKVKIYRAYSDLDEANFVGNQISQIKKNKNYKDFAILYRTNAQSRIFEDSLRRKAIPYRIIGGTRFYDRKEIKDILCYLKVIINPQDDVSLKRIINVPKRSIGDTTVNKLQEFAREYELNLCDVLDRCDTVSSLSKRNISCISGFASLINLFMDEAETMPVSLLIETILKETGYLKELETSKQIEDKSRIENLKELVSDAVEFEKSSDDKSLSAYLEQVSLVQDTDKLEDEDDAVLLMTVHSAKGLEFPVVFMVGMENGLFPSNAAFNKESEMEEARRLCYVGITRAKEELFMTSADQRRVFGRTVSYSQSDFLSEIEPNLKEYVSASGVKKLSDRNFFSGGTTDRKVSGSGLNLSRSSSLNSENSQENIDNDYLTESEISLGMKVVHQKFGVGTIVSIQKDSKDKKVTVAFDRQGVKILLLSFAKLKAYN
ncbi:DNA helicase PcrA [Clostridium sp. BJN0001]|uniref:DNA helicase PcrA n=1 Tax=Clostridium sp. BJN0001 TaxID=2930219 RepID=UPI001FD3A24A|nr:DNA helicase PcrA [Clostridium sp. BJN0001]